MNRNDATSRTKERDQIIQISKQPDFLYAEADKDVVAKLFTGQPYTLEDMQKCISPLLKQFGVDKSQCVLSDQINDLRIIMPPLTKPVYFVFAKQRYRWVLLLLVPGNDGVKMLYKDSAGGDVPQNVEAALKKLRLAEIRVNNKKGHKVSDDSSYGPSCLRNLILCLQGMKKVGEEKFLEEFQNDEFCTSAVLSRDKLNNVSSLVKTLSDDEEFTDALKKFVDGLPFELGDVMDEYNAKVKIELNKHPVDYGRIAEIRRSYLGKELTEKFSLTTSEDGKNNDLTIQKDFPQQMKELQQIFQLLSKVEVNSHFYDCLDNISEMLKMDPKKLKRLYKEETESDDDSDERKLTPGDIKDISLPEMKTSKPDAVTPFDQLTEEVQLGADRADDNRTAQELENLDVLEEKYYRVKTHYAKWRRKTLGDIRNWAGVNKNHLEDVTEAIAVMDRALNLLTGGHRLRDTQILSVLIFFHDQNDRGRLCQIQTGEGKTVIISLLAVIRVLQGRKVDVISSSPLLAQAGVDETRNFYSVFNMTVATNNGDEKSGYTADVLYGTISNFQFDFLKETIEGYNIRQGRHFGHVIMDEVDSMLVDNGGHIAKLASPYPGMECLKYVYIKIWEQLHVMEDQYVEETREKLVEILKGNVKQLDEFVEDRIQNMEDEVRGRLVAMKATLKDIPSVPKHLHAYIDRKMETWIDKAIYAKYHCHEHQQYRITKSDEGEPVVTPVDYMNTGVTMRKTLWSNGLHQFVQLKHNLRLTFETLTSSFISNIGYIKKYKSRNLFGLTGTLGSTAEQNLLSHIYTIDYAKIPTYKKKTFQELPGVIADDESWLSQLTVEILKQIETKRAVLVICETEQDLLDVKEKLELLRDARLRIRTYANEDNAEETKEKVRIGDVILATNIAGRGTNFKTVQELERSGGLHVLVGFLPCNKRVEDQAFGRTSRQGNSGTAQLVIRRSEAFDCSEFVKIKEERDSSEKQRLQDIGDSLVPELNFKDELFQKFADLYRGFKQENDNPETAYLLDDFKEFWAFWLENKNFEGKNIQSPNSPVKEFEDFKEQAKRIIEDKRITHNPFYSVSLASFYMGEEKLDDAHKELCNAINIDGELAGPRIKMFELALANGSQVKTRILKAFLKIFFVDISINQNYKKDATDHLRKAKTAIDKEVAYFENNFWKEQEDFNVRFGRIIEKSSSPQSDNLLLKHLQSRVTLLKMHQANMEELLQNLESTTQGLDLGGKVPTTPQDLQQATGQNFDSVTPMESTELGAIGVDALYTLKTIGELPDQVRNAAVAELITGVGALAMGICFPPMFPVLSDVAGNLIPGAILDLVMAILDPDDEEFQSKDFMKHKFIEHGKALLMCGFTAALQSVKILTKAIGFCRKLTKLLRKSKKLKNVCAKLAKIVERLQSQLKKLRHIAKLKKVGRAGTTLQRLKRSDLLLGFFKKTAIKTTKSLLKSFITEEIIDSMLKHIFDDLLSKIKQQLKPQIIANQALMAKLETAERDDIDSALEAFLETPTWKSLVDSAFEIALKGAGIFESHEKKLKILLILANDVIQLSEVYRHFQKLSSDLEERLKEGDANNNVDEVVDDICEEVVDKMFDLVKDVVMSAKEIAETAKAETKDKDKRNH